MREMTVATNEIIVLSNSDILREVGKPNLATVHPAKKQVCAWCHIIGGSAETMVEMEEGGIFHAHCSTKFRRFKAKAKEVAQTMRDNGVPHKARKTIMRAVVAASRHVHS